MFPYHDENETQRTPYVDDGADRAERARLAGRPGRRAPRFRSPSRCASSGSSRRAHRVAATRRPRFRWGTGWSASPIRAASCPTDHVDVPARVLDAPARQHVVSVAVRQQHRGLDDAAALCRVLPAVRSRRGAGAGAGRSPRQRCRWSAPPARSAASWARTWCCSRGCGCSRSCRSASTSRTWRCRPGPCSSTGRSCSLPAASRAASRHRRGGVAFWAHLGGFIAGVVLVKVFERRDRVTAHASHHWQPRHVGWR